MSSSFSRFRRGNERAETEVEEEGLFEFTPRFTPKAEALRDGDPAEGPEAGCSHTSTVQ